MASFDKQELTIKVKEMYKQVAENPKGKFHFEMGRALAEKLGYLSEELDKKKPDIVGIYFDTIMYYDGLKAAKIAKEKGISPEEAARFERYDFFKRAAKEKGIDKIAVGHTRDDQAETVLMRIIRGAGMKGLGGISSVKDM